MSSKTINRETRYTSHVLVELRRNKWWPFDVHSGVLLDLSMGGFKLELTGEKLVTTPSNYTISIPLSPLGIDHPRNFSARIETRWFDERKFRLGGIFSSLSEKDKTLLESLIDRLAHTESKHG